MRNNRRKKLLLLPLLLLTLNSCIGLSMDIQMRRNGSGRIFMEYRISRMAESLGRLDSNGNRPVIPAGREDLERTIERNPGMRLISFSLKEGRQDTVINAAMEYDNTEALLKFLDPSGTKATLIRENQSGRLNLILNEPASSQYDEELINLMREVFDGYNFSISFSAEGNSAMTFTDGEGNAASPPQSANIVQSGRKVSLSMGIMEILNLTDGFGVNISW